MTQEPITVSGITIENLHVGEDGTVAADITYDDEKITEKEAEEIFTLIINDAIMEAIKNVKE